MILIDEGEGSSSLIHYPPLDHLGILTRLPSPPNSNTRADVYFDGCGPCGSVLKIGIEIKEISEFADSLSTGRLQATQLPGLMQLYDIRWLCIIGEWRRNTLTGNLQIKKQWKGKTHWFNHPGQKKGTFTKYQYISKFLCGASYTQFKDQWGEGINTWCVPTIEECAAWIGDLYVSWLEPYESHHSMRVLDKSGNQNGLTDKSIRQKMSQLHDSRMNDSHFAQRVRSAASLPGISYNRAVSMAEHFPSVQEIMSPLCTCRDGLHGVELREYQAREEAVWSGVEVEDSKGKKRKLGKLGQQIGEAVRRKETK